MFLCSLFLLYAISFVCSSVPSFVHAQFPRDGPICLIIHLFVESFVRLRVFVCLSIYVFVHSFVLICLAGLFRLFICLLFVCFTSACWRDRLVGVHFL